MNEQVARQPRRAEAIRRLPGAYSLALRLLPRGAFVTTLGVVGRDPARLVRQASEALLAGVGRAGVVVRCFPGSCLIVRLVRSILRVRLTDLPRRTHHPSFYLPLTGLGQGGNLVLRSVCDMTAQPPPASSHHDGFPRPQAGGHGILASEFGGGPGVHPGESDPARMLAGVLVLVVAAIIVALTLVWWLA